MRVIVICNVCTVIASENNAHDIPIEIEFEVEKVDLRLVTYNLHPIPLKCPRCNTQITMVIDTRDRQ